MFDKIKSGYKSAVKLLRKAAEILRPKAAVAADKALDFCVDALSLLDDGLQACAKMLYKGLKKLKNIRARAMTVAVSVALCFSLIVAVYAVERHEAVEVIYGGKSFGFVASAEDAEDVVNFVCGEVYGEVAETSFTLKNTTVTTPVSDAEAVKSDIMSDAFLFVSGLFVNDELTAVAASFAEMQAVLDVAKERFLTETTVFKGYADSVAVADVYTTADFFESNCVDRDKMLGGEYGIRVVTCAVEEYSESLPYGVVTEYSSSKKSGYEKVKTEGEEGLRNVVANVTYINGERQSAVEIESRILETPKDEVKLVGTKKTPVYHSGYVLVSSIRNENESVYTFPLKCGSSVYISAFWGDERGHKGLDIAAPKGTEIYAAADGVVTYSGYGSSYGYYIIVDHGDGKTQTLYSHNKTNLVKVGETVSAGQLIGYVGATGNATGNHLHFEVRINGNAVDPASYVGIK